MSLHSAMECKDGCGIVRYPVVWPGGEVELGQLKCFAFGIGRILKSIYYCA